MGRKRGNPLPASVKELRGRIVEWRQTRDRRTPMPPELWAEAVALARAVGIHRVARGLGVSYESLLRRVAQAAGGDPRAGGEGRGFVEVSGAQLLGLPSGAVVELAARDGVRLTIRLGAGERLDVAGLVQSLCQRRA